MMSSKIQDRDLYLKKMVLIAGKRGIHGENPV